ncbi:hypothetical protein AB0L44_12815 [Nonomuraea wenchangensis]|uniref:hypothetical protein n=1 Tax=Nonomuraea wenchangensis TaxID=568860 RepID=UPI00341607EC
MSDDLEALPLDELRDAVARITVERLLPELLALPDDRLRDVLGEALARRLPYEPAPGTESRLFLAVRGPAPGRKTPAWRHPAVAAALPRLGARDGRGRLAYEGRCAACGTPLRADTALAACPVCGATDADLTVRPGSR